MWSAALLLALVAQSDPVSRSWNQPVEPFRIIRNIYYVGASDITAYLIATPKGHILIDGGFVETAPMILDNVKKLGFHPADIRILLNSHAHYDHAGGLAAIKSATGATFMASEGDAPQLAGGGKDDPQFGDRFLFPPITPDKLLRDGDRVALGGMIVVAHVTAGHTRGCTTWTTTAQEAGKTYNVVFGCSLRAPIPLTPAITAEFERSFKVVRALPCDIQLGDHPAEYGMEEKYAKLKSGAANPFIDAASCRREVDMEEAMFHAILSEQQR